MAHVVQQGGHEEQFGVRRRNRRFETAVVRELPQEQQRQAVDAQRVFEPGMNGRRIDQRHEPQLADLGQAAELAGVDDRADAIGQRHIQLGGDPHHGLPAIEARDFRKVA